MQVYQHARIDTLPVSTREEVDGVDEQKQVNLAISSQGLATSEESQVFVNGISIDHVDNMVKMPEDYVEEFNLGHPTIIT